MTARRDGCGDLGQVQVHRLGIASRRGRALHLLLAGQMFRRCRWKRCADWTAPLAAFRRLAQRRVILFFRPILASSANQISIAAGLTPLSCAICPGWRGNFFKMLDCSRGLGMVAQAGVTVSWW